MNKIIIGVLLSIGVIFLYEATKAWDGMGAFSGRQPIFWWFYGAVPYIPLVLVIWLVGVGLKTIWKKEN